MKSMHTKSRRIAMVLAMVALHLTTITHAQEAVTLDPSQQRTLMQYAGLEVKPLVPVALLNKKMVNLYGVAEWMAARRRQGLQTWSLNPKSATFAGPGTARLDSLFKAAADSSKVLYFEDADLLFGNNAPSAEQTAMADRVIALAKKHNSAVLFQCNTEAAYFALAKKGLGIVAID